MTVFIIMMLESIIHRLGSRDTEEQVHVEKALVNGVEKCRNLIQS
jgi:hypothetical protein